MTVERLQAVPRPDPGGGTGEYHACHSDAKGTMSMEHDRAILEAVFTDTANGDGRRFVDTLADDVRWTIIGTT
ncbi:hypothetical protein [Ramlibacter sp. AN1133]|uniref:hypothetical protein n=1 Tax=Ramlibacter sp. AN1133 TaxID=3133429 RepID=UPI0030BAC87A